MTRRLVMHPLILLFICIFIGAGGQVLLKKGAMSVSQELSLFGQYLKMLTNPPIVAGLLLYAGGALLWLRMLQKVKLSFVYPIFSLVYVVVALASKYILKERFTDLLWVGICMICIGVSIILFSQRPIQ